MTPKFPTGNAPAAPAKVEVKAATEMFKHLKRRVFPDLRLGLVHGRMTTGEYAGLAVSMRERRSGDMAWHAVAAMTYYSNLVAADEIPKAVALVLEDFPPS